MNIKDLDYVVETAANGSINAAAKKLSVPQPNISRAIGNIEKEYGIKLFERSPRGIVITREGQHFVEHASKILDEMECLNDYISESGAKAASLKVAIPKECYASYAFANFAGRVSDAENVKLSVRECSSSEALDCVIKQNYDMAMIRIEKRDEKLYHSIAQLNNLATVEILKYQFGILTNADGPIADMEIRSYKDLEGFIELRQGDARKLNGAYVDELETSENVNSKKRIYVYERGSQLALLKKVPNSYMWESPMPARVLEQNVLIQIQCPWRRTVMKDILLYSQERGLSDMGQIFLEELKKEASAVVGRI